MPLYVNSLILASTPSSFFPTEVSIEMSLAKDKSLTVVITGKGDAVVKARRMVVQQLQKEVRLVLVSFDLTDLGLQVSRYVLHGNLREIQTKLMQRNPRETILCGIESNQNLLFGNFV